MEEQNQKVGWIGLWLAIGGMVLPILMAILDRMGFNDATAFLCALLFLASEVAALGCGIASRKSGPGRVALIVSAGSLILSVLTFLWFSRVSMVKEVAVEVAAAKATMDNTAAEKAASGKAASEKNAAEKTPDKPAMEKAVAERTAAIKTQMTPAQLALGDPVVNSVGMLLVPIPAGEFKMGSTAAEKEWAVGQEGGASFSSGGGVRESYEGESRSMRVAEGFWIGRTEVTVGQFRMFVASTGFVTDAEKPGGKPQCFNAEWVPQNSKIGKPPYPWIAMKNKSWRAPNHGIVQTDQHPVVCVSYNDMKAFCAWLTKKEKAAGSLPDGLIFRLPTEAEWAYACRGGRRDSSYYWWGNDLNDAKGRLNISAIDFLPGKDYVWSGAKLPWSDGFAMVSPVDHYGKRGRNGFGLADMCGGVWEFVLDHFDPKGGHEQVYFEDIELRSVSRPVCRGGTFYDVPGNARCAVRLGISSVTYSDSRDGFRVCLGVPR